MPSLSGKVQTVSGVIDPTEMGATLSHEHLLLDICPPDRRDEPGWEITLENSGHNRRESNANRRNLALDSEADAIEEMRRFREHGGRTVVEVTSIGLERDAPGLKRIAEAAGVHIVMGCSYYVHNYHPDQVEHLSERDIVDEIVRDVSQGVDGTDIRAGIIGEVGLYWPHHEREEKVLRASAIAQQETGAALMIHPGRNPASPLQAIAVVKEAGGDPARCIMAHIDRTLFEHKDMAALAETGCYLEFDLFGQESSYYTMAPIDMPNDAMRIDHIRFLMGAGYGEQVVVAQDICHKNGLTRYGGDGYCHLLKNVVPVMHRKGMSEAEVNAILVDNPARILAFA